MNILHENSHGIQMVRVDMKKRSKVTVRNSHGDCMRTYRFNNIQDRFESPYISWANLDCCGGWACDEAYLDTAVQCGAKLYAGKTQTLKRVPYFLQYPTKSEALDAFEAFKKTLPEGVVAGQEELCESNGHYLHTDICRTGTIAEHIDLDAVFDFYCKLGIYAPRDEVRRLCDVEIRQYGTPNAPFVYFTPCSEAQLITTGLLLGYPLESTASILCGY